jgi:hypothetical protein
VLVVEFLTMAVFHANFRLQLFVLKQTIEYCLKHADSLEFG